VTYFTFGETKSGVVDEVPTGAESRFPLAPQNIDRGRYQVYRRRRSAIMIVRNNPA
jgi:hypothetical protein